MNVIIVSVVVALSADLALPTREPCRVSALFFLDAYVILVYIIVITAICTRSEFNIFHIFSINLVNSLISDF